MFSIEETIKYVAKRGQSISGSYAKTDGIPRNNSGDWMRKHLEVLGFVIIEFNDGLCKLENGVAVYPNGWTYYYK